jgi:hypothetical protein
LYLTLEYYNNAMGTEIWRLFPKKANPIAMGNTIAYRIT